MAIVNKTLKTLYSIKNSIGNNLTEALGGKTLSQAIIDKSIGTNKASDITVTDADGIFQSENKTVENVLKELFTSADNGRRNIISVIGSPTQSTDNFSDIALRIQSLKNQLATNLTAKKVTASPDETIDQLIAKIPSIQGIDTSATTAVAADVLSGKKFVNALGQTITGNMSNNGRVVMTPGVQQTIAKGYHDGTGYVKAAGSSDPNLKPENIVSGVTIYGVTGNQSVADYIEGSGNGGYLVASGSNLNLQIYAGGIGCLAVIDFMRTAYSNTSFSSGFYYYHRAVGLKMNDARYAMTAYPTESFLTYSSHNYASVNISTGVIAAASASTLSWSSNYCWHLNTTIGTSTQINNGTCYVDWYRIYTSPAMKYN